jgi:stage II sporulation protein D
VNILFFPKTSVTRRLPRYLFTSMTAPAALSASFLAFAFYFQCVPSQAGAPRRYFLSTPKKNTPPPQAPDTGMQVAQNSAGAKDTARDGWGLDREQHPLAGSDNQAGLLFHVPSTTVRIVLYQGMSQARVLSSSAMELLNGGTPGAATLRGGATIERGDAAGRAFLQMEGMGRIVVPLPCTLFAKSEFNIVKIENLSCRGSVIVAPEQGGLFTLVSFLDVEEYLRGVVPLEVGRGSDDIAEAVKAQAVAARTYTYRKMQDNARAPWDLAATVADQVYGGVGAESEQCNRAIRATAGEVMLYRDSLIYAYYHSTCGGRTASIEDAWNKSPLGYLRSVDDNNGLAGPFCSASPSFTWEEQWPLPQFTFIVNRYSREAFPQNPASGEVRSLSVDTRFFCGRVKQCSVRTSSGAFVYGGDKIRFVFRRNSAGYPILKSSLITGVSVQSGTVVIKGRGYGHGVGMCQMGAIGRARAGKKYDEILKAYYTDITIKRVTK